MKEIVKIPITITLMESSGFETHQKHTFGWRHWRFTGPQRYHMGIIFESRGKLQLQIASSFQRLPSRLRRLKYRRDKSLNPAFVTDIHRKMNGVLTHHHWSRVEYQKQQSKLRSDSDLPLCLCRFSGMRIEDLTVWFRLCDSEFWLAGSSPAHLSSKSIDHFSLHFTFGTRAVLEVDTMAKIVGAKCNVAFNSCLFFRLLALRPNSYRLPARVV